MPKTDIHFFNFGPLSLKNAPATNFVIKTAGFCTLHTNAQLFLHISHRRTTATHDTCRSTQPHSTQIPSVCEHSQREWSCPHRNSLPSKKWQPLARASTKIATTLGLPQSTTKRWLLRLHSEGEMVSHNIARPRGAEAGVCVCVVLSSHFSSHICRGVRDLCVCSVGLMIKSGACSCQDADQRLGCHRAVRFSRQCSQTSAGVWHRAQPPQRPRGS